MRIRPDLIAIVVAVSAISLSARLLSPSMSEPSLKTTVCVFGERREEYFQLGGVRPGSTGDPFYAAYPRDKSEQDYPAFALLDEEPRVKPTPPVPFPAEGWYMLRNEHILLAQYVAQEVEGPLEDLQSGGPPYEHRLGRGESMDQVVRSLGVLPLARGPQRFVDARHGTVRWALLFKSRASYPGSSSSTGKAGVLAIWLEDERTDGRATLVERKRAWRYLLQVRAADAVDR